MLLTHDTGRYLLCTVSLNPYYIEKSSVLLKEGKGMKIVEVR